MKCLNFLLNFLFSSAYYSHFFCSLKCPESFLLSLPPDVNCSNDKSLLPMCEISEPDYVTECCSKGINTASIDENRSKVLLRENDL